MRKAYIPPLDGKKKGFLSSRQVPKAVGHFEIELSWKDAHQAKGRNDLHCGMNNTL